MGNSTTTKSFLITRPNHDITTRYLYGWNQPLVDLAVSKNLNVIDLKKERANRSQFEGVMRKTNPRLVVINGHGNHHCVTGHQNEVLIEAGKNQEILKDKIIYSLSCKSAGILGLESVRAGAACYIGYKEDFTFYHQNKTTRPRDDKVASLFLSPSNQLVTSLIKGNSAKDALAKSRQLAVNTMQKLLSSSGEAASTHYAKCIWWNLSNQACIGDTDATF